MPSVVRKQNNEAPSHETIGCEHDEVVNSAAERLLVDSVVGHFAAEEVTSLRVDASPGQWPTETSDTAYSAPCRAAQLCVATENGLDSTPVHTDIADIEMAEMYTDTDDAHANEHSKNTEYNSMDDVNCHCDAGDHDYRLPSLYHRSPYFPRRKPNGCGDKMNGHQDEPVQPDEFNKSLFSKQRPYGKESTAIDMSGIDESPGNSEPTTEQQHTKDAVSVITCADGAGTSQDESGVNRDAGMSQHDPMVKHQRKLPSHLPFLVSADGKSISDLLNMRPIRPSASGIELFANSSASHAKGSRQENEQARLARKLEERKAKREYKLPVAQSVPGYVGDKSVDFCLSYITGRKADVNGESFDKVSDGSRLKHKKKKKSITGASSSPGELSSFEGHPSSDTAPCAPNGHRVATVTASGARASALAPNARPKEGTVTDSSRTVSTGSHSSITVTAADDVFHVVDRKKKAKNQASSTGCQSLRLPTSVLPARNILSSTIPLGNASSIIVSNCPDDDRSEGDGNSSPSSCTVRSDGSLGLDAGDDGIFLGSLLQQQQPTTSGPLVSAKAEPPKVTWAAVAAARSRGRDSAAAVVCHSATSSDQSCSTQNMVAGDEAKSGEPCDSSSPRGAVTAADPVQKAASYEATGYQPPAVGLPETVIQSSAMMSLSNAIVDPAILTDSSQIKSTPPEPGADSYCDEVRPVAEKAAGIAEVDPLTSFAKLVPATDAASCSAPASSRKMDASTALPEVSLQRCKGVEFVGSQWREFFSRDSPRRIAFGFHDALNSSSSSAATGTDDKDWLQVSLNEPAAGRKSDDSPTVAGSNMATTACRAASVPATVPAEEDAKTVATPTDISEFPASHVANVSYLTAVWLDVEHLRVKDASCVHFYVEEK